ncbi:MAG: class I SAM-dependent methyltransferase [Candidatus Riflebacteria bacterium]|nr:class I SAM-dependent methyltransferase [Candidatus Riflebacteria bacterium]
MVNVLDRSAELYDLIYRFKDYKAEATRVVDRLLALKPECRTVLDVACGTAEHDRYFKNHFEVEGLDVNERFVAIARVKNPECRYHVATMTDFDLGKRFDAVLVLFSSIGYAITLEQVASTFRCLRDHVTPGGVILVEPWFTPESWKPGHVHMVTAEADGVKVCRLNVSETRQGRSYFEFHYLVGTAEGVTHLTEEHTLGLFTVEQMKAAFGQAGLTVEYDPDGLTGRGLYVARPGAP